MGQSHPEAAENAIFRGTSLYFCVVSICLYSTSLPHCKHSKSTRQYHPSHCLSPYILYNESAITVEESASTGIMLHSLLA